MHTGKDAPKTTEPITDDASRFGDPRITTELITNQPHLFHLGALAPTTFLRGQQASVVFVTLQPGATREPHWHPSSWEVKVITSGVATWTLPDTMGISESFDAHPGGVIFAPQGSLHYFENRGHEDLSLVIVFQRQYPRRQGRHRDWRVDE